MNYFKKFLGFKADLEEPPKTIRTSGTLYVVHKQARVTKSRFSQVAYFKKKERWYMRFTSEKGQACQEVIHPDMDPVVFPIYIHGNEKSCFEWHLEGNKQAAGCYVDPPDKQIFKGMLCSVLKEMKRTANHLNDYCKQLTKDTLDQLSEISDYSQDIIKKSYYQSKCLSQMVARQKQDRSGKIGELCNVYSINENQKTLIQQNCLFVLKTLPNLNYEIQIVCENGSKFLTKAIQQTDNYQFNIDQAYIRWIDLKKEYNILEVNFYKNNGFVLILQQNLAKIQAQLRQTWLDKLLSDQQIQIGTKSSYPSIPKSQIKSEIVQVYKQKKPIKQNLTKTAIWDKESYQTNPYLTFFQGKISNFSIAASGCLIQKFHIREDNQIECDHKQTLLDKQSEEIEIGSLLLNDTDSKAMVRGRNGKLYYHDLVKGKLIQQYDPCPKTGITAISYSLKAAQANQTFKALSKNAIYEIDIRAKNGIKNHKQYSGNPYFKAISPALDENFVTGSHNGEIRFIEQLGKNANNKMTFTGESVTHLDTTKDGKWVLATFPKLIRLIPSQNNSQVSLFRKKILIQKRPSPIQLEIPQQSLKEYGVKQFSLLPAKFDQCRQRDQKWIVSGFDQYTVVWELSSVIKGHKGCFISKNEGKVLQADFLYNNPGKMMIATSSGITISQTKRKN